MPELPPLSSQASITPAVVCDCWGGVSWWACHLQILATPATAQRAALAGVARVTVVDDHVNEVPMDDCCTYIPSAVVHE